MIKIKALPSLMLVGFTFAVQVTSAQVSCLKVISEIGNSDLVLVHPTERKTMELRNALPKMQANEVVQIENTASNEYVSFQVAVKTGTALFKGRIVGASTENGQPSLILEGGIALLGESGKGKHSIPIESIQMNTLSVLPIIGKEQVQQNAVQIQKAFESGLAITFREVRLGKIMDAGAAEIIESVKYGQNGLVESFITMTSIGLSVVKGPESIVPGSIRAIEIEMRKLSPEENKLLTKIEGAQSNSQRVNVKMKIEKMKSWGPSKSNSATGTIDSIRLAADGEWIIYVRTPTNDVFAFRLDEINPSSFQTLN